MVGTVVGAGVIPATAVARQSSLGSAFRNTNPPFTPPAHLDPQRCPTAPETWFSFLGVEGLSTTLVLWCSAIGITPNPNNQRPFSTSPWPKERCT